MAKTGFRRIILFSFVSGAAFGLDFWNEPAAGFHDGGVAHCNGCHVMHGNAGGMVTGDNLLLESTSTDTCLLCHLTSYGNSWGIDVLNPGPVYGAGPFVFLLEDNLRDGPGGNDPANLIPGNAAGHNVISLTRGTIPDPVFSTAPGGAYPSNFLHCSSCHDPHGKGSHYRMLYGNDYPDSLAGGFPFQYTAPPPQGAGISVLGSPESASHHNVYQSGFSDWCGSCHGDYHHQGNPPFKHPVDRSLNNQMVSIYNSYEGTGFFTGDGSDSYQVLVPLESISFTGTDFRGPVPMNSRIMCLSCHRAHASSAPRSGRWDFNITEWSEEGVFSGSYPIPNPYPATAGLAQRPLCEICHGTTIPD